jgi:hypothetical protein
MIEILLMFALSKSVGKMMRAKGRSPGGYQFLAIALWIGGEIAGAIVGASSRDRGTMYMTMLLGAAIGATLGYVIAASVKPAAQEDLTAV